MQKSLKMQYSIGNYKININVEIKKSLNNYECLANVTQVEHQNINTKSIQQQFASTVKCQQNTKLN